MVRPCELGEFAVVCCKHELCRPKDTDDGSRTYEIVETTILGDIREPIPKRYTVRRYPTRGLPSLNS
jgi:hypothetical protein